jgi:tetratricopeptide (TPR) repeat protein
MRGDAWKMLFGNLLFVIGVPVAIVQLIRSYGGASVGGLYKGLDSGNIAARKGDLVKAVESYRNILSQVPTSAGVKYNLGMALLAQRNQDKAAASFEKSLEDCSNYVPAYGQLRMLYQQAGETQKLKKLEEMWSSPQEEGNSESPVFED